MNTKQFKKIQRERMKRRRAMRHRRRASHDRANAVYALVGVFGTFLAVAAFMYAAHVQITLNAALGG